MFERQILLNLNVKNSIQYLVLANLQEVCFYLVRFYVLKLIFYLWIKKYHCLQKFPYRVVLANTKLWKYYLKKSRLLIFLFLLILVSFLISKCNKLHPCILRITLNLLNYTFLFIPPACHAFLKYVLITSFWCLILK